ncbi:hypothetical protein ACAW63_02630 [Pseudomonas sp. QE6]|uniref:hypothetical protein n=1 Tax=Pseudomonas sp. QE6 TaxID=3242491 RepID=UPI003529AB67
MNTKTRGHQVRPTKAEVTTAWGRIRSAADAGDLQAAALLVALAENKPFLQLPEALGASR